MMSGWIKLHRKIQEHWVFSFDEPDKTLAFIDIVLSASYADNVVMIKGRTYHIKRGQFLASQVTLQKRWKWSQNKVSRFLNLLKKEGVIDLIADERTSIISVCNYSEYQGSESAGERTNERAAERATNEQSNNTKRNKELEEGKQLSLDDSGESTKEAFLNGLFEKFWKNYTCEKTAKVKKQDAKKAFLRLMRGKPDKKAEMLTYAMLVHYQDNLVGVVFGADRMHPTTYINKRQWEDNPEFLEDFEKQWELENAQ